MVNFLFIIIIIESWCDLVLWEIWIMISKKNTLRILNVAYVLAGKTEREKKIGVQEQMKVWKKRKDK